MTDYSINFWILAGETGWGSGWRGTLLNNINDELRDELIMQLQTTVTDFVTRQDPAYKDLVLQRSCRPEGQGCEIGWSSLRPVVSVT